MLYQFLQRRIVKSKPIKVVFRYFSSLKYIFRRVSFEIREGVNFLRQEEIKLKKMNFLSKLIEGQIKKVSTELEPNKLLKKLNFIYQTNK